MSGSFPLTEFPFTKAHSQRGDFLLESLIGVVLISVVALGLTHTVTYLQTSQTQNRIQQLAIGQMRALLQSYGNSLCADSNLATLTLPPDNTPYPLEVRCDPLPVSLNDYALNSLQLTLTLTPNSNTNLLSGPLRVGATPIGAD